MKKRLGRVAIILLVVTLTVAWNMAIYKLGFRMGHLTAQTEELERNTDDLIKQLDAIDKALEKTLENKGK